MAPTILVVGATGNTGRGVMDTLPQLVKQSSAFKDHRILALTRSKDSAEAKRISKLPGVELAEKNWIEINADWLRGREIVRAFIASHNGPTQFAEESQFLVEALHAGVKYVVRISTTTVNVKPGFYAYYPRTHWAIETMLSQPDFQAMQWTSLQPNVFTTQVLGSVVQFIKEYRQSGKQGTLSLMFRPDGPVGVIDAPEVGVFAARLLSQEGVSAHHQKRYNLNGPEDITGNGIVKMTESCIGEEVRDVKFADMSFIDQWADSLTDGSKNVIRSIKAAGQSSWEGKAVASATSKEMLEIAPPKRTAVEVLDEMLNQ